jgi:hypothetical protein
MQSTNPSWQSTVIALAFIALVGGIFIVVYEKDGIDTALKAWGAIGTLVGVVVGAVPTYFFGRTSSAATAQQLTEARRQAQQERQRRDRSEAKAQALLEVTDQDTIQAARQLRPDLFGKAEA